MRRYGKTIGKQLVKARNEAGFSQTEMAKKIGLTQVGYSAFERGRTLPSIDYLMEISKILQKPIAYFLDDGQGINGDELQLLHLYRNIEDDEIKKILLSIVTAVAKEVDKRRAAPDGLQE